MSAQRVLVAGTLAGTATLSEFSASHDNTIDHNFI